MKAVKGEESVAPRNKVQLKLKHTHF